jgi:Activator of Hsp90 ATPase homolog 1-like protein
MLSIDIVVGEGPEIPNLGCVLDVVPMQRLVWTSMLFPGYRPAVFDDIPITAVMTMEAIGDSTRYVLTNMTSGFYEGTAIAVDQLVAHVLRMR